MQHQQDGEENVEDVVCRKHLDDLRGLDGGAVEDVGRVDAEPSEDPCEGKACKQRVTGPLVVRVLAHLSSLKKDISTIVDGEDQCSNSGQVASPGESH